MEGRAIGGVQSWETPNYCKILVDTLGFQTPCEKVFGPQKHT